MGALWAGYLYRGFTVGNRFLRSLLEDFFVLKTCLLLETDGERRVLVQKLCRKLARTRAIE